MIKFVKIALRRALKCVAYICIALVLIELSLSAAFYARRLLAGDTGILYRFQHGTHDAYPDMARALSAEDEGKIQHDILGVVWGPRPLASYKTQTLGPHGFRASCCAPDGTATKTFYVLGGSTVYGTGVDDAHTVSSYLNRLGRDRGWRFYNYGSNGADSTQEALLLSILLRDKKIPDGVLIYHGFNDYYSAVSGLNGQGYVAHSFDEIANSLFLDLKRRVFEHTQTARLVYFVVRLFTGAEKPMPRNLPQQIETSLGVMKGNYDLTNVLGKAYGFPVYHFLQPMMATGVEKDALLLNDFTTGIFQRYVPPEAEQAAKQFYGDLRQDGRWIDLSSIFVENQTKNVYIDEVHLGPNGNALVAKYIFETLTKAEDKNFSARPNDNLVDQGH